MRVGDTAPAYHVSTYQGLEMVIKRMLGLCENIDQRILPSKTQAYSALSFAHIDRTVLIISSVPSSSLTRSPRCLGAVTAPGLSLLTTHLFEKFVHTRFQSSVLNVTCSL